MVVALTVACSVVGTLALAFSLGLVLMCEKDLFSFQLKLVDLFPDLGEPLFGFLVGEVCHVGLVVGLVVRLVSRASLHHESLRPSHCGTNILTADQV